MLVTARVLAVRCLDALTSAEYGVYGLQAAVNRALMAVSKAGGSVQ